MQVEILRVKGNRLLSIDPAGRATDAVATMAKENRLARRAGAGPHGRNAHLPRAVARDRCARRLNDVKPPTSW